MLVTGDCDYKFILIFGLSKITFNFETFSNYSSKHNRINFENVNFIHEKISQCALHFFSLTPHIHQKSKEAFFDFNKIGVLKNNNHADYTTLVLFFILYIYMNMCDLFHFYFVVICICNIKFFRLLLVLISLLYLLQ